MASTSEPLPVVLAARAEQWPLARLKAYKRNPRRHSVSQIDAIIASIRRFGFINPIAVSSNGTIVAGHGRLAAAEKMKLPAVPVIVLDHLSEAEQRAYRIADNQLGLISEWDEDTLRAELAALEMQAFPLEEIAFDEEDLAAFMAPKPQGEPKAEPDPEAEAPVPVDPISRIGDVWILGRHRLVVGDCKDRGMRDLLMQGKLADLVFTDPPYNVDYEGYTEEKLTIQADAMSSADFKVFLRDVFRAYKSIVKLNASIYVCHPSSWQRHFENAMIVAGFEVRCQIIWAKNTFAWGHGRYKFQHEPIFYGHVAGQKDRWFGDKSQSTLWAENKPAANRIHPTAKPVEIIERALANSAKAGDLVVDLFGGSGSTLMACELHGQAARLMEIEPRYADAIVNRWQEFTGQAATLAGAGSFAEVSSGRIAAMSSGDPGGDRGAAAAGAGESARAGLVGDGLAKRKGAPVS